MRRYTTPTIALLVEDRELFGTQMYVTIKQGSRTITVPYDEMTQEQTDTGVMLTVDLTQLQTAGFDPGRAQIQVNWLDADGLRGATEIAFITITDNLLTQTMAWEQTEVSEE